ncbi:MAG: hypothetical protein ACI9EK_002497, partial [Psychroserpens sp.]
GVAIYNCRCIKGSQLKSNSLRQVVMMFPVKLV